MQPRSARGGRGRGGRARGKGRAGGRTGRRCRSPDAAREGQQCQVADLASSLCVVVPRRVVGLRARGRAREGGPSVRAPVRRTAKLLAGLTGILGECEEAEVDKVRS